MRSPWATRAATGPRRRQTASPPSPSSLPPPEPTAQSGVWQGRRRPGNFGTPPPPTRARASLRPRQWRWRQRRLPALAVGWRRPDPVPSHPDLAIPARWGSFLDLLRVRVAPMATRAKTAAATPTSPRLGSIRSSPAWIRCLCWLGEQVLGSARELGLQLVWGPPCPMLVMALRRGPPPSVWPWPSWWPASGASSPPRPSPSAPRCLRCGHRAAGPAACGLR